MVAKSRDASSVTKYFSVRPVTAILLIPLILGVAGLWWAMQNYPGLDGDWMSYRSALDRLFDGEPLYPAFQSAPYVIGDAAWGAGYVYPPSSIPMLPLTIWVWPWRLLNLAVLLYGTWVATRSPLAVAFTLAFPATWAAFANGNAMPLIVGMYGIAYGSQVRWWGVIAGAVKPFAVTLLVLSWKRGEPILWPAMAVVGIAFVAVAGGYLPVVLNAEPICRGGVAFHSLQCREPLAAYAVSGLLLGAAVIARTDRLTFALLCLAPFALAPDWTWAYWSLPMLAMLVLLGDANQREGRRQVFRGVSASGGSSGPAGVAPHGHEVARGQ